MKKKGKKNKQDSAAAQKYAKFMCKKCKKLFDEPGYCPSCDIVLKKQAG